MWLLSTTSLNKACGTVSMLAMRSIFKAYKTVIFPCSNQLSFTGRCISRKAEECVCNTYLNNKHAVYDENGIWWRYCQMFKIKWIYVVKWLCGSSLLFALSVLAPLQTLQKPVSSCITYKQNESESWEFISCCQEIPTHRRTLVSTIPQS